MAYDVGAMVKVRGRDWVVLPGSTEEFLLLKPLGGSEAEVTGIFAGKGGEDVDSAKFLPPDPATFGPASSARLMVNAAKLAIRSGAGPFRSLGRLGVEPRPYQLVPLLMALRQTPARLLIADDVGVGKTVEAGLIARELLDRQEIGRIAVLCPPHLAEQWVEELRVKFGIDAVAVLPSTVKKLERDCNPGQSVFLRYKFVVVSLDLVKSDRWRMDFLHNAPEFVIVDEAHASAEGAGMGVKRHQRYRLLEELAGDPERHLLLVTATPHSGKEDAFRSLLKLLNPEFATLELSGTQNERARATLARHLVQRGRQDVQDYLQADTPFPKRHDAELKYSLHPDYAALFEDVLAYARESVRVAGETHNRTRIRWWAALGLLRALASSPQAAAATLRARALSADETDEAVIESLGRELVYDPEADEREALDLQPGAQVDAPDSEAAHRLNALADRAEALAGDKDRKLGLLTGQVTGLLKEGFAPIVFCRFIATAEAVAEHLDKVLKDAKKEVKVEAVTGRLTPAERVERIQELSKAERRVLVATDCLSEGINLQETFSAVIHYDLPWNPTRLDQREGRVDRYGQLAREVRVLTLYGQDNRIDTLILDVLVKKHRKIRELLGTSLPAPEDAESLLDVLLARVLSTDSREVIQPSLFAEVEAFDVKWRDAAEGEKKSRSRFAQRTIRPEEVAGELEAVRAALGDSAAAQSFVLDALQAEGVIVTPKNDGGYAADPAQVDVRAEFKDFLEEAKQFRFDGKSQRGVVSLARNHPLVEQLASTVLGQALDDPERAIAKRVGVIRTSQVSTLTTLLLLRHRFHLTGRKGNRQWQTLAEELDLLAYRGRGEAAEWLSSEEAQRLLDLQPEGNLDPVQKTDRLTRALTELSGMDGLLLQRAKESSQALLEAHERVRGAAKGQGVTYSVEPPAAPDLLGVYVFLPMPKPGGSA